MAKDKNRRIRLQTAVNWRRLAVVLLAVLGIFFLTAFTVVHWTERQLLTTDNYVELVTPLPKNDSVSAAIATESVDKLFENINLQTKITEVLPSPAAFLAPTLTEELDQRATRVAQTVIQSDQFRGIWTAANRAAHQRLMDYARSEGSDQNSGPRTQLGVKLEGLSSQIKERLGSSSQLLFQSDNSKADDVDIKADLQAGLAAFRRFVQAIDFLNSVLLWAALACLIGALALSRTRRLLMVILTAISVISLLQLIGIKVLRPEVLNLIEQESYRPAVGYIYDQLVASFKTAATTAFAVSAFLFLAVWLGGSRMLRRNKYLKTRLRELKITGFWRIGRRWRQQLYRYRWQAIGVISVIILAILAFVLDAEVDWTTTVIAALIVLTTVGLISLISLKPRGGRPLKLKPAPKI